MPGLTHQVNKLIYPLLFLKDTCLIILSLVLVSCASFRNKRSHSDPPDYSNNYYWAALPFIKDSADAVPANSGLKDMQSTAKADVFFIHPTNYVKGKKWNVDLQDTASRNETDKQACRFQAGAFNSCCKVYAPRYRTAKILSYFVPKRTKQKVFDLAYNDIKTAFIYYLTHFNNGRPFIIASHSQGSDHAVRLCKEFFDKDSALNKMLIAAYMPGAIVYKQTFSVLKPCEDPGQTGCFVTWNCVPYGELLFLGKPVKDVVCVNPLTWKTDHEAGNDSLNKGGLPVSFDRIDLHVADAQISPNGLLWIHKPKRTSIDYPKINTRSFHFLDYNLFYMNIRLNAKQRVDSYFHRTK
jgi:hypothetical protein